MTKTTRHGITSIQLNLTGPRAGSILQTNLVRLPLPCQTTVLRRLVQEVMSLHLDPRQGLQRQRDQRTLTSDLFRLDGSPSLTRITTHGTMSIRQNTPLVPFGNIQQDQRLPPPSTSNLPTVRQLRHQEPLLLAGTTMTLPMVITVQREVEEAKD